MYDDDEYTECKLITLKHLKEHKHLPEDIKELVIEQYKSMRNQIPKMVGAFELAYRRGYAAGIDSMPSSKLVECERLVKLFKKYPCEEQNSCKLMSGVDMLCPPCQVRFQLRAFNKESNDEQ